MPGEMYRLFDEYKRDEWERFLHTTTEWGHGHLHRPACPDRKPPLRRTWNGAGREPGTAAGELVPSRHLAISQRDKPTCAELQESYTGAAVSGIGAEMTSMLQALRHRGPDSTGFAIYGTPAPRATT